jgi:hypothetical protein
MSERLPGLGFGTTTDDLVRLLAGLDFVSAPGGLGSSLGAAVPPTFFRPRLGWAAHPFAYPSLCRWRCIVAVQGVLVGFIKVHVRGLWGGATGWTADSRWELVTDSNLLGSRRPALACSAGLDQDVACRVAAALPWLYITAASHRGLRSLGFIRNDRTVLDFPRGSGEGE